MSSAADIASATMRVSCHHPVPIRQHEQVGDEDPDRHAEGDLGDPAQPLAVGGAQADHRGDRREERRGVAQHVGGEEPGDAGRERRPGRCATPWPAAARAGRAPDRRPRDHDLVPRRRLASPCVPTRHRPIAPGGFAQLPAAQVGRSHHRRKGRPMFVPMDPTAQGFMIAESRNTPMHVGGLQLFTPPRAPGPEWARETYESSLQYDRHRAALPQATHPLGDHRPAPGSGAEDDAVRPRVPRPAQRAPRSGTDPRAPRALRPAARHPAGARAAAVGDALHRGARGRPVRDLHQAPPRARRRGRGDAAAPGHPGHRPRRRATPRRPGRPATPPAEVEKDQAALAERLLRAARSARSARRWRSAPRRPACPARWSRPSTAACATRPRRSRSTPPGRSSTGRSPAPGGSPPRTGRSTGSRRIGKATGTTINDVVLAMCSGALRHYLLELDALPGQSLIAMVPVSLKLHDAGSRLRRPAATRSARSWSSSAPTWPTPPTGSRRSTRRSTSGKEALAEHVADADPRDERARRHPAGPGADAADAGAHPAAVQPGDLQRARARASRST